MVSHTTRPDLGPELRQAFGQCLMATLCVGRGFRVYLSLRWDRIMSAWDLDLTGCQGLWSGLGKTLVVQCLWEACRSGLWLELAYLKGLMPIVFA